MSNDNIFEGGTPFAIADELQALSELFPGRTLVEIRGLHGVLSNCSDPHLVLEKLLDLPSDLVEDLTEVKGGL